MASEYMRIEQALRRPVESIPEAAIAACRTDRLGVASTASTVSR